MKDVFTAPLGTIFVLAGVLFLLIAVVGKISGKIEPGQKERVLSGILGSAFITIGLAMYWWSLPHPATEKKPLVNAPSPTTPQTTHTPPDSAGDNIPDWVPGYPAEVKNLSIKIREGGGQYGSFFFMTDQQPDAVLNFYQMNLEMKRWEVTKKEGTLSAANEGGSQTITVTSGKSRYPLTPWIYTVAFSESERR